MVSKRLEQLRGFQRLKRAWLAFNPATCRGAWTRLPTDWSALRPPHREHVLGANRCPVDVVETAADVIRLRSRTRSREVRARVSSPRECRDQRSEFETADWVVPSRRARSACVRPPRRRASRMRRPLPRALSVAGPVGRSPCGYGNPYGQSALSYIPATGMSSTDPWERHAGWWQDGFTDGVDPEYEEQILPLVDERLAGTTARARRRDAAKARSPGCGVRAGRRASSASTRPRLRSRSRANAAAARDTRAPAPRRCRSATRRSTRRSSCLVFEHIDPITSPRSPRWHACSRPAAASCSS